MNNIAMATLEPKLLGFWTRCIRETSHLSQEALAESSGLDVRTIQRIEAGKSVSITTRRLLARGLGYDRETFDDPQFIMNIHKLSEAIQAGQNENLERQFPEHVRISCSRVAMAKRLDYLLVSLMAFC